MTNTATVPGGFAAGESTNAPTVPGAFAAGEPAPTKAATRFTTIACLLTLAFCLVGNRAQAQVRFGFKGGLDLTQMRFKSSDFSRENRAGFFIGPVLKVRLPLTALSIDVAGFYDRRSVKVEGESMSQQRIEVPANLRLGLELGNAFAVFVAAGPQLSFNVGDEEMEWSREGIDRRFRLSSSDFSVNLGGGFSLGKHWELSVNYNIGIGNTGELTWTRVVDTVKDVASEQSTSARSNYWRIGLGYFF